MPERVKPIPAGYHSVTPYLIIKGAAKALDFYRKAFGATELFRMATPDGQVGHAEIMIGDSHVMLADEPDPTQMPGYKGPKSLGGTPVSLMIYIEDVDSVFARSIGAGGKVMREVQDQFYGDRTGTFEDPFGHVWTVATHKEDLSPEEIERRAREMGH